MNGGTLKGLILMRFEGEAALTEIPALRNMARWFIAHEAAHFWLGQAVGYEGARDSWIMEGGADLLAVRTVGRLDPAFDGRKVLNERPARLLGAGGKAGGDRHRAGRPSRQLRLRRAILPGCGKGQQGRLLRLYQGADRRQPCQGGSQQRRLAGGARPRERHAGSVEAIRGLLEFGSPEPKAALAGLLKRAGIAFTLDPKGVPQL